MNLVELLSANATQNPDRLALVDGKGQSLTFAQLDRLSQRGAQQLLDAGVSRGDAVMFAHPIAIEVYVALLASFRIGAVAVFFDPSAGREIIDAAVERTNPKAFFGGAKAHLLRLLKPSVRKIPVKFATVPGIPAKRWLAGVERPHEVIADCEAVDPALITFTSGSTGQPKAVVRSHGFLLAQYEALSGAMHFEAGDVDLITLPVFTLANLAAGMTSVLAHTDLAKPGSADAAPIDRQLQNETQARRAEHVTHAQLFGARAADAETGCADEHALDAVVAPRGLQIGDNRCEAGLSGQGGEPGGRR
ncbi:MAG: AMP-binding protein, partial [Verrucomicrobiota bacterium]